MFNLGYGVLQTIYTLLASLANSEMDLIKIGVDYGVTCMASAWGAFISYFVTNAVCYILITLALKKVYKQKGYKQIWQCFLPIVQIYALIRIVEGEYFWKMSKKTISIIFFISFGLYVAFKWIIDIYYFKELFGYMFAGKDLRIVNKGINILLYFGREGALTIAGVILIPILNSYFRERSNQYVWLTIGSLFSVLLMAIFILVFVNKKPRFRYNVPYGYHYGHRGYYQNSPYDNNGNYNNNDSYYQQPESPKEPFSEFNKEENQEPFTEFYTKIGNEPFNDFKDTNNQNNTNNTTNNNNEEDDLF